MNIFICLAGLNQLKFLPEHKMSHKMLGYRLDPSNLPAIQGMCEPTFY